MALVDMLYGGDFVRQTPAYWWEKQYGAMPGSWLWRSPVPEQPGEGGAAGNPPGGTGPGSRGLIPAWRLWGWDF